MSDDADDADPSVSATLHRPLPSVLPIFPLTGTLLLPGGRLPLYLFETRYCHMAEDILAADRCIGMVQPRVADPSDNFGPAGLDGESDADEVAESDTPEVFSIGCVGEVERYEEMPYGRYVLLLRGISRFRIERELALHRGYRRVDADYDEFAVDREELETIIDPDPLLAALERFGRAHRVEIELDQLDQVPGLALLNSVASALPFSPIEQQALLEAPNVAARHQMLLTLLDMGLRLEDDGEQPN